MNPTDQEIAEIQQRRLEKFKKMGIAPTFSQQQVEQAYKQADLSTSKAPMQTRDRINAIRNGSMRSDMHKYNSAENKQGFVDIPVNKPRNRTNPNAPKPQVSDMPSFDTGNISSTPSEFQGVDSMFDDSMSAGYNSDIVMGNDWNQRKAAQHESNQPLVNANNYSQDVNLDLELKRRIEEKAKHKDIETEVFYEPSRSSSNSTRNESFDYGNMLKMIEYHTNKLVDDKLKGILEELKNNKKPQPPTLSYKKVKNKEGKIYKDLIQIDGKIYKITEVKQDGK